MSDQPGTTFLHHEPDCAFCGEAIAPDDCVASVKLLSHTHGQRYFGAHARCWQKAVRPEIARLIDLADVPPGLDHFLTLPPNVR
jgi:hypothetical protein